MTSKDFFGTFKFKDINLKLYNEFEELVYEKYCTTFANAKPLIGREIDGAIESYKKWCKYEGEPVKCVIYTTPACHLCIVDLLTNKKEFKS